MIVSPSDTLINGIDVKAYTIPTNSDESDGTYEWSSTTIVIVRIKANGRTGTGYTYAHRATAELIRDKLGHLVTGRNALHIPALWNDLVRAVRNDGRPGICAMAISAIDAALWDLKARLTNVSLVALLGRAHDAVEVYASGGFTSYDDERLERQMAGWIEQGFSRVKMKAGRSAKDDIHRVRKARKAIGDRAELFVDANGAYTRKNALEMAHAFHDSGVTWFEEPVSSDNLEGLRLLRDQAPPGMDIAAGEYGYTEHYFRTMLSAGAVDVLQADVTRCCGITGFQQASALCEAFDIPLSAHCAPQLSAHICAATRPLRHLEYFYDHARIEEMLFDGIIIPKNSQLIPDESMTGNGLLLKSKDAEKWRVL